MVLQKEKLKSDFKKVPNNAEHVHVGLTKKNVAELIEIMK